MLRSLSGVKAVKVDFKGGAAYVATDPEAEVSGSQMAEAFNGLNDGQHQFKATATQTHLELCNSREKGGYIGIYSRNGKFSKTNFFIKP